MNKEYSKALIKFKRCIDQRNLEQMDNNLYRYLNNYCSFIAHYDIAGFKHYYRDIHFLKFVDHFINPPFGLSLTFGHPDKEYQEINKINQEMTEYVRKHSKQIHFEFENKAHAEKIRLLKELAEEVGYEVKPKGEQDVINLHTTINSDGQLALI